MDRSLSTETAAVSSLRRDYSRPPPGSDRYRSSSRGRGALVGGVLPMSARMVRDSTSDCSLEMANVFEIMKLRWVARSGFEK